jgi:2'-5' RNA ligase
MRIFIAIDLSREIINEIKKIQELLKKQNLIVGKFTEPENLHLTLKFLGEVSPEELESVKEKLNNIKFSKFQVSLSEVGAFSKNKIKIIWIKLNGKGIFQIQKAIDESLAEIFKPEARFMSHITIARINKVSDKKSLLKYLNSLKPRKISFILNKFFLKKSELLPEGPIYTDISEFTLE